MLCVCGAVVVFPTAAHLVKHVWGVAIRLSDHWQTWWEGPV